ARFVIERCAGCDERTVAPRADLHPNLRARGGTARAEHFVAAHHDLDRPLRLARERDRQRLEIDHDLSAEPAADFARDHLDLRGVHPENGGALIADRKRTLRRAPDDGPAVFAVAGHAGVRLDVALVDHRGPELALDDDISFREALLQIAALQLHPS